ncbi:hypothetical protein M5E82_20210 [Parabacteroides distasonis]|nr:hypothetical protein M5E82_20210 [Parabacteroides distasonis]
MEKKKQIGEHIVDHLSERMNEEIVDPVLDEWLAEDESNQEDFKRYKEIWKETGSYLEQKLLMLNTHGIRSIVSIKREIISGNAW